MSVHHLSGYSDTEIATIGQWLRDGLSARGIAGRLSVSRGVLVTRNAIIGIVQRNKTLKQIGFQRPSSRSASATGKVPPKARGAQARPAKGSHRLPDAQRGVAIRATPMAPAAPVAAAPAEILPPDPSLVTTFLAAATAGRCLFFADAPMAPAGPDMPVCGCERQTRSRKPYCEYHLRKEASTEGRASDRRPADVGRPVRSAAAAGGDSVRT